MMPRPPHRLFRRKGQQELEEEEEEEEEDVVVPIQDENGDDGGRWQGGGKLVCSRALQSDGRHTSNNRENSINQNRT